MIVNITQVAPKRKRARKSRGGGGQPVVYREFQKVIYSDANPIQIYENQNRYKNIDVKPATKSQTLGMLEDVGQVGTEGRVEILPRTSREQTEDIEFVSPVAKMETEKRKVRQSMETQEPLKLTSRGQNTEMAMPENPAVRLIPPTTEATERMQMGREDVNVAIKKNPVTFNFAERQPDEPPFMFNFSEGFEAEEQQEKSITKKPRAKNPLKKRAPISEQQREINNAKARLRYAMKKGNA